MADGLGVRAVDSNELRRKQGSVLHLQTKIHSTQTPTSGVSLTTITTPQNFSDLYPEITGTPPSANTPPCTPKPNFSQASNLQSDELDTHSPQISLKPSFSIDRVHDSTPENPNHKNTLSTSDVSNNSSFGPHSPCKLSPNSARKPWSFQAGDCPTRWGRENSCLSASSGGGNEECRNQGWLFITQILTHPTASKGI